MATRTTIPSRTRTRCAASGNGASPSPSFFTYKNLLRAYNDCKKRKTSSRECLEFSLDLEANLLSLQTELLDRSYRPGRSVAFVVTKPKFREVFAAQFRDRVVHHLLYNYLSPIYEPRFIYDSFACRPGKGTHAAMKRVQDFAYKASKGGQLDECYYLQMDVKSFFTTIDKAKLYEMIARNIKRDEILWLTELIIHHDPARDVPPIIHSPQKLFDKLPSDKSLFQAPTGYGLPIGNLTSQFFANVYLNDLDQYVKHQMKIKWYVRYVDDFVIIDRSWQRLRQYEKQIIEFVKSIGIAIKHSKTILRRVSGGIDIVGYVVRPHYVLVRKRVVHQWRLAMERRTSRANREQSLSSYTGHALQANTYSLRRLMDARYSSKKLSADFGSN